MKLIKYLINFHQYFTINFIVLANVFDFFISLRAIVNSIHKHYHCTETRGTINIPVAFDLAMLFQCPANLFQSVTDSDKEYIRSYFRKLNVCESTIYYLKINVNIQLIIRKFRMIYWKFPYIIGIITSIKLDHFIQDFSPFSFYSKNFRVTNQFLYQDKYLFLLSHKSKV